MKNAKLSNQTNNNNHNNKNINNSYENSILAKLYKNKDYIDSVYEIKEGTFNLCMNFIIIYILEVKYLTRKKLYGYTKNKMLSVVITEEILPKSISILRRIEELIKLIDNDLVLIENIWLDVTDKSK